MQNAPSAKRFNRANQGASRCTSRYEIYNSTMRPFGKSYRDMMTTSLDKKTDRDTTDTGESSAAESNPSAYVTCCSEVETLNVIGFRPVYENATEHEVTAMTTVVGDDDVDVDHDDDDVAEARNYDVDGSATDDRVVAINDDETLGLISEPRKKDDEQRLMYNMPTTSTWKTYEEEQLTYEPGNEEVRKEVVTRSRSLFNLREESAIEEELNKPQTLLMKATSENLRLFEKNATPKPTTVMRTTPATKYSSAMNLTLAVNDAKNPNDDDDNNRIVKYKSQCDLRCVIIDNKRSRRKLERPKSMDFLVPKENKSHAETLKKHFYYNPLKQTKKLNDNELPDPDKVLSTRRLFQKELKIPLPPSMNNQNPKTGPRPTQEVRVVPDTYNSKSDLKKCVSADMGTSVHNRWTDSGSVSSGVGSEGSFDTESSEMTTNNHHNHHHLYHHGRGGTCGYSSDDEDYLTEKTTVEIVGRPVSADILDKIRKFGTSVTYYGGKVISSSRGAVCSPMTMTIMDEIRHQKEENVKLRLVKSNSCGSRMELMEEPKRADVQMQDPIQEEDEDEDRRDAGSGPKKADGSVSSKLSSASSDETSWKALIVIRKKMQNTVPVFDMEFEEFEVLEEKK